MRFLNIPLSDLMRQPVRSFLTVLGICAAVASFVILVCMSRGLERAWINSLAERGIHMLSISGDAVEILTATIDEKLAGDIQRVDGVKEVSGELVNLVRLTREPKEYLHVIVRGWPHDSFLWETLRLQEGRLPGPEDERAAIIGETLSKSLDLTSGDVIALAGEEFTVTGVSTPASVMNDSTLIVHLPTLQRLLNKDGKVTEFAIRLDHPEDPAFVAWVQKQLIGRIPSLSFIKTRELADNNDILKVMRAMAWGSSLVAMAMAFTIILNTLLMSVTERTRDIGILSALGWGPARILLMILMEGIMLSIIGSIAGFALGTVGLHWIIELPKLRGFFEPEVSWRLMMEVITTTLILGLIGSLYPVWRGVRLNPVDALKYE